MDESLGERHRQGNNGKAKVMNSASAYAVTRLVQFPDMFQGRFPVRVLLDRFKDRNLSFKPRLTGIEPTSWLLLKSLIRVSKLKQVSGDSRFLVVGLSKINM